MTATQAPTPGPLDSESVKLLRLGKPLDTRAAVGALCDGDWLRETWLGGRVHQWRHGMDIQDYRLPHTVFIGRPDESGWMPWSGGENPVPGKWCEWFFAHTGPYAGLSSDTLWDRVTRFRLAPTAPVEASGSEREHGPKCWGGTSFSDEMAHCYCGSTDLRPQPSGETREHGPKCWGKTSASDEMAHCYCGSEDSPQLREAVLKGVGKINGDGWKDTTTEGEIVFVWNAEKPTPYAAGQYPRIGNEGWSASTSQYDFTPATANDVPAIRTQAAWRRCNEGDLPSVCRHARGHNRTEIDRREGRGEA